MGGWVDGREGRLLKRGEEDMNRREEGDGGGSVPDRCQMIEALPWQQ